MKKLALGAILGASLMISSSAFALTAMTDANMKSATGQAGVSIAIDNVKIEQYVGSTSYIDEDGSMGTEGSVVITEKHTIKNFLAMVDADDYVDDFNAASNTTLGDTDNWVKASALTIDVGNCVALTDGLNGNITALDGTARTAIGTAAATIPGLIGGGMTQDEAINQVAADLVADGVADNIGEAKIYLGAASNAFAANEVVTGVVIGLPTLLISTTADTYCVGVKMDGAINDGANFIKISKGASTMAILSGTVEIAAH